MARRIQDFKWRDPNRELEIVWESEIPDGATVENLVHGRMRDHYANKSGIDGVRVVNQDDSEIYRWTWADEANERLLRGAETISNLAKAELRRREKGAKDA